MQIFLAQNIRKTKKTHTRLHMSKKNCNFAADLYAKNKDDIFGSRDGAEYRAAGRGA